MRIITTFGVGHLCSAFHRKTPDPAPFSWQKTRSGCRKPPMKMEMQSGNLLLVFIYSLSLLLIGCAVGMHWRGSPSVALCITIFGAALFVLHELVMFLLWFGATAV